MDTSSFGFRYWTTYEPEGDQARITANYMREQTQAAVGAHTGFHLDVFGLGGGLTIRVRATTRMAPPATMNAPAPTALIAPQPSAIAGPPAARMVAAADRFRRPVLTSPTPDATARRGIDGGLFDLWEDGLPDWVIDPPPMPPTDPQPPGGGGGGFMHTEVRVELYAPGIPDPVQTWELPEEIAGNYRELKYQPMGFPAPDAPVKRVGWWRVVVTPTSGLPAMIRVEATAILRRVPFRTRVLSKRLSDHVFRVVLEALVPRAFIDGQTLKVGIGAELAHEFGVHQIVVEEQTPYNITSPAQLKSLAIKAESGRMLKTFAQTKSRQPIYLPHVQDNDVVIRIEAGFSKGTASAYGFELGRLNGDFGVIFMAFSRDLLHLRPVAYLDVDFSTLADWALSVASLFTEYDHDIVNTKVESAIASQSLLIRTYFREVLSRAMGEHAVVHEVSWGGGGWQVRYFDDPPMPEPNTPWRLWRDNVTGSMSGILGLIEPDEVRVGGAPDHRDNQPGDTPGDPNTPSDGGASPTSNDPPGVFPAEFLHVDDPVAIERLDRHQCLVVIMMENRSYDHLLGGLAAARPRPSDPYDGPPASASNAPCGGFRDGVPLVRVEQIGLGTMIPVDPRHFTKPTLFQMGDGSALPQGQGTGDMQGFARDLFAHRSDSPQLAMTMYGEAQLPTYYKLADDFRVADRWFCAHPGPTWPNRYAMVLGSIPLIDNHDVRDPSIGFLKHSSIFDTLTAHGIEWKVFESDLSLVRTFDRYRLDDRRVVPMHDQTDGLLATLRGPGPLPRVMFIEPNFADLPPLATANDDHPPTDLKTGQLFIAEMCDLIWKYRFNECLVCITYDEHGGFYDHVPPPGTKKADPALLGTIPKLHPDGPEFLGPRVPAFIMSPYTSAGKPDHTVYDHTSILKTILVHNRAKLPRSVMAGFGPRVNWAAHLGAALDLAAPRSRPLPFDTMRWRPPTLSPHVDIALLDDLVATDVALGSASALPPAPARTVTILPASVPLQSPQDEPDFHASLKGALKPRT